MAYPISIGDRFGRLTVISDVIRVAHTTVARRYRNCKCDCGNEKLVQETYLRNGSIQSCRCLQREATSKACIRHGHSRVNKKSETYAIWEGIRKRCRDKSHPRYGQRGIALCERWLVFENFLADMGERPSAEHSIERIDNDGGYSPDNCKWATAKDQANNRHTNRVLEWNGEVKTLAEWCTFTGMKEGTIRGRIDKLGWSVEKALSTPPRFNPRWHQ